MGSFLPDGRASLIGSLPLTDHRKAADLVQQYTPEIPVWVQLPAYTQEGMVDQFLPGIPGLRVADDRCYIDTSRDAFDQELIEFYEEFMNITESGGGMDTSRFILSPGIAPGFYELQQRLSNDRDKLFAVKGQVTGPITLATATKDQENQAIFYDARLRDVTVKLLALKAKWQAHQLSRWQKPVIMFIDEPALAGFGSSEFTSISREDILACLGEVIEAIHAEKALAGIHVCANTDWSMIMETAVDIVNFDAYSYFDRFILYADALKSFLASGGTVAWGIVPTLSKEDIARENTDSLMGRWQDICRQLSDVGIDPKVIRSQALITPSCGTGSLSVEQATKVLTLTRELSDQVQNRYI
jgi:methionine synthase II (cobalamin-independent)